MASTKPTIFLIHGAWHTPACFSSLTSLLKEAGYPVVTPANPSTPGDPPTGLIEDALNVVKELEKVVEEREEDVLVIGHSYGGMVTSQGVLEKFAKKKRETEGKKGGVLRIVYLCAMLLGEGESMATSFVPITGDPNTLPARTPVDVCICLELNLFSPLRVLNRNKATVPLRTPSKVSTTIFRKKSKRNTWPRLSECQQLHNSQS
jgi:hypothetical protein